MRSLTVLEFTEQNSRGKLTEAARDYCANWMTAVTTTDENGVFMGAENEGNLFVVRQVCCSCTTKPFLSFVLYTRYRANWITAVTATDENGGAENEGNLFVVRQV